MNIFNSVLIFLRDFWNLLEEFVEQMRPQCIQENDTDKTE